MSSLMVQACAGPLSPLPESRTVVSIFLVFVCIFISVCVVCVCCNLGVLVLKNEFL